MVSLFSDTGSVQFQMSGKHIRNDPFPSSFPIVSFHITSYLRKAHRCRVFAFARFEMRVSTFLSTLIGASLALASENSPVCQQDQCLRCKYHILSRNHPSHCLLMNIQLSQSGHRLKRYCLQLMPKLLAKYILRWEITSMSILDLTTPRV